MCSPKIAQVVSERIRKQGRPNMSRRNFLKIGGLTASGLAVAGSVLPTRHAHAHDVSEVLDLSHAFTVEVPTYIQGTEPSRETVVSVENDGFYIQRWTFEEHTGTHMDIPAHFIADGTQLPDYPVELLVSPAIVIDIAAKAEEDPDAMVTPEDLQAWESENGEIPVGALVCMYSGWDTRFSDVAAFRNADDSGVMHFPGFSGDAAAWLVEERDIHGIAVDTLSLDNGPSATFDVHYTILGAGKYGVEGVANLGSLMGKNATVVLGIPKWEAGSGGPVRAIALVNE